MDFLDTILDRDGEFNFCDQHMLDILDEDVVYKRYDKKIDVRALANKHMFQNGWKSEIKKDKEAFFTFIIYYIFTVLKFRDQYNDKADRYLQTYSKEILTLLLEILEYAEEISDAKISRVEIIRNLVSKSRILLESLSNDSAIKFLESPSHIIMYDGLINDGKTTALEKKLGLVKLTDRTKFGDRKEAKPVFVPESIPVFLKEVVFEAEYFRCENWQNREDNYAYVVAVCMMGNFINHLIQELDNFCKCCNESKFKEPIIYQIRSPCSHGAFLLNYFKNKKIQRNEVLTSSGERPTLFGPLYVDQFAHEGFARLAKMILFNTEYGIRIRDIVPVNVIRFEVIDHRLPLFILDSNLLGADTEIINRLPLDWDPLTRLQEGVYYSKLGDMVQLNKFYSSIKSLFLAKKFAERHYNELWHPIRKHQKMLDNNELIMIGILTGSIIDDYFKSTHTLLHLLNYTGFGPLQFLKRDEDDDEYYDANPFSNAFIDVFSTI